MKMKFLTALFATLTLTAFADEREQNPVLFINPNVTTHIVMPENIKMVDISTDKILGNQSGDNILRLKPNLQVDSISGNTIPLQNCELAGTVTIIGERHITQYDIRYMENSARADAIHYVPYEHLRSYVNPDVSMPEADMARYAWAIYSAPQKFYNLTSHKHGLKAVVNNIYSVGDYFFIDFSLYNKTKIAYDIAEMRIKLTDKKEVKATNSQTIELLPVYSLNNKKKFKKSFRNVIVVKKLTFPDEKVLKLEISENQISGRVIELNIEYEDILHSDSFDSNFLRDFPSDYKNTLHIYR